MRTAGCHTSSARDADTAEGLPGKLFHALSKGPRYRPWPAHLVCPETTRCKLLEVLTSPVCQWVTHSATVLQVDDLDAAMGMLTPFAAKEAEERAVLNPFDERVQAQLLRQLEPAPEEVYFNSHCSVARARPSRLWHAHNCCKQALRETGFSENIMRAEHEHSIASSCWCGVAAPAVHCPLAAVDWCVYHWSTAEPCCAQGAGGSAAAGWPHMSAAAGRATDDCSAVHWRGHICPSLQGDLLQKMATSFAACLLLVGRCTFIAGYTVHLQLEE